MGNKTYISVFVVFIALFSLLLLAVGKRQITNIITNDAEIKNERSVYIGFWTHGLWNDETKSVDPSRLREIENKIGKKVAIANYFRGWEHLGRSDEIIKELDAISSEGWVPMVSTNPYFFSECPPNGKTLYKAIADGDCDQYLHKISSTLKEVPEPFFLRFAWEMNVNTMEWSIVRTASSPSEFIAAWRRFHTILKNDGVTNAIWVFSPQVETPSTTDISLIYPGDDYVDWIGLDGYNWGNTQSWSSWQSFKSIYFDSYLKISSLAPTKPIMIAEVNTSHQGGDQARWYKDMLSHEIPNTFPEVDAIVFFNEDKRTQEGVEWKIDASEASLYEFRKGLENDIYKSEIRFIDNDAPGQRSAP